MSQYINAEKLTTIIEEKKAQQDQWITRYHDPINQGISHELTEILSIIASLQQKQPEVDLEKEYNTWWNSISDKINIEHMMEWYMHETARHFYELGRFSNK